MLLSSPDTRRTLMHLFLFTNSAQRELVSIYTRPQLTFLAFVPWVMGIPMFYGKVYQCSKERYIYALRKSISMLLGKVYLYSKERYIHVLWKGITMFYGKVYLCSKEKHISKFYNNLRWESFLKFSGTISCLLSYR